jgi:peptidoglycan/xylan/chitin deacetylase (PgdA/CDA1 family)
LGQFKPLSLTELARAIRENGRAPERSLFLSFDDGFRETIETIAPICLEKGVPATFFLNTAFLDNRALCFRHKASILAERCILLGRERTERALRGFDGSSGTAGPAEFFLTRRFSHAGVLDCCAPLLEVDFDAYLRSEKPYLTGSQVKRLTEKGFEIGAHSIDHPLYSELTLEEQLFQTRQSMSQLAQQFHPPTKGFAFPFVSDGVKSEFYRAILDDNAAELIFCLGGDPEHSSNRLVQRFGVEGRNPKSLIQLLRGEASRRVLAQVRWWRRASPLYN